MRKLKILTILLLTALVSMPTFARQSTTYTVTCTFSDGTGWEINTTSEYWFGYYSGVCATQQQIQ